MPRSDLKVDKDTTHIVRQGDCFTSIAYTYGFFWETLWNLAENSDLRNKRKNANVLMPGDEVFIPAPRLKEESRATEATHKFLVQRVASNFRLRLLAEGQPRSGLHYTCTIDGSRRLIGGTTDSDGLLSFSISPDASYGVLRVIDGQIIEEYRLLFGHLNPVADISGVQQRLHNLGYSCDETGELDDQTEAAIALFRLEQNLRQSESADNALRDALLNAHGC